MFGGGGMNPRKMEQMMKQMGIDVEELDATEVTITLEDGTQLYFDDVDVTKMDARGQETYQIVGSPEAREPEAGSGDAETGGEQAADADETDGIPEDDIELVAQRTGASKEEARAALEEAEGDLAAAIASLE